VTSVNAEALPKYTINIFPVPTEQDVFVNVSNDFVGEIPYTITDTWGRKMVSSSFFNSTLNESHHISTQNLSSGMYQIVFKINGTRIVQRFIVHK